MQQQNFTDESIVQKIGYLREKLFECRADDRSLRGEWGITPNNTEADEVEADLQYLCNLAEWYTRKGNEIYAAILTPKPLTCCHCGGVLQERSPDPLQRLRELARAGGPGYRLGQWVVWLKSKEMLPADFNIDLAEPVNEAQQQRDQAARAAEAKFQEGYAQLRAAVREYGRQGADHWGYADSGFLQVWNKGKFSADERGLLSFAKALAEKNLLPPGYRAAQSFKEMLTKVKGVFNGQSI
jgi:hypothetical protein